MKMNVRKITFKYRDVDYDPIWVITDSYFSIPILPLLYTSYLSIYSTVFKIKYTSDPVSRKTITSLVPNLISDTAIRSYVYCLNDFLRYMVEDQGANRVHASESISTAQINKYLNNILPSRITSISALESAKSALNSYYNFLCFIGVSSFKRIEIYRKTRALVCSLDNSQYYIKYLSGRKRSLLLMKCKTLSEKLVIRMGFEVGLRTSELVGLRVKGEEGLEVIFKEFKDVRYEYKEVFSYRLKGRYTKRGKSRWIYFDRSLIKDMYRYYSSDRKKIVDEVGIDDEAFFIRTDKRFRGTGITVSHGTNVFRKRAREAGIERHYSYHDLRHTFATVLFHQEISNKNSIETRSESAALLTVGQRLGHSIGRDGYASEATSRYVRMRLEMLEVEGV